MLRGVYGTNTLLRTGFNQNSIFCFLENASNQPVTMSNDSRISEAAIKAIMRALRNSRSGLGLFAMSLALSLAGQSALAQVKVATAAPKLAQNEAPAQGTAVNPATSAPVVSLTSQALNAKGQAYRQSPDDSTWRDFVDTFRVFLSDGRTLKVPASAVIQQNRALKDLQARGIDAGGARVWTFSGSQHNHTMVIQSGGGATEGSSAAHAVIVPVPDTVNITAAKIVRSFTTTTTNVKVKRKIVQKTVRVEGPSMLVVAGLDRVTGLVYLGAYRPGGTSWSATSEPFSQIPSHFMQTLSGQVSFSGNDLVLSIASPNPAPAPETTDPPADKPKNGMPRPKSSSYQIVLKFVGGHFTVAGTPGKDVPLQVITSFVQCMRTNRMDLAKAWIAEPALISIPKYIGLTGRNQEPYKLVAMSAPLSGGTRHRLVTGGKHDLIFDCGKVKKDILIKGLFIAPPDPLTKNLMGTMIGAPPPPPAPPVEAAPAATTPVATPPKSN